MGDDAAAIERFRALLRIPTVSRSDPGHEDREAFARFRAAVAHLYPLVHQRLELELIDGGSLLYRWPGQGTGRPSVLMAHHDVVPADEPGWRHEPFAADVSDGRIWGRGALDDKGALVAMLEAVEARLRDGFTPAADVYLFSGANEETFGEGAEHAVDLLTERGVRPGLVLDEGGAVAADAFPGLEGDIAFVGVAEKGLAGILLTVEKPGGHAATPVRGGATTTLARAIVRLEQHPPRARLSAPAAAMLRAIAPRARGLQRRLFAHPVRYRRALARALARRGGEGEAIVRTTRAVTRLTGSAGDNIIAERATATINARIAIGSSVEQTAAEVRQAIDDDQVGVEVQYGNEPSPVSPSAGPEWDRLVGVIERQFPRAIAAPYVMMQASDSRHFTRISDTVYRFLPFELTAAERGTIHAIDESIRIDTWVRAIAFFDALVGEL
ncbi:MAG TPA: M20/M25/M40 family metallo-hydrolase [Pseudolysinimonas sp.]|nr:M20/M25/M40 family metallo-hydrolase [Pseudolysinimonas sp.]